MMMMPSIFGGNLFNDDWMDFSFPDIDKELYGKHAKNLMKTDVKEKDGNYEVAIDLPGFKKDEITAELKDGYLTISAAKGLDKDEKDKEGKYIMVVTERGYGKMSPLEEYRLSNRGGKGVKTINATERNGQIVALRAVNGDEDLLIITDDGIMIRLPMEQVKTAGRATQGVRLIKVNAENKVSSVEVVEKAAETR